MIAGAKSQVAKHVKARCCHFIEPDHSKSPGGFRVCVMASDGIPPLREAENFGLSVALSHSGFARERLGWHLLSCCQPFNLLGLSSSSFCVSKKCDISIVVPVKATAAAAALCLHC